MVNVIQVALAYDQLARDYNLQLARNPVAGYMRTQLQAHMLRVFHAGDRVLDFTAGTGLDAHFLALHGIHVTALDASPLMIAELQQSIAGQALPIETRVLPAERLNELEANNFDGAITTFAGLNTITNLSQLASDLSVRLEPGGRLVIHALNSFCFWQWLAAIVRGRSHQRRISFDLGGQLIQYQLYRPKALWRTYFAQYFDRRGMYGLSIIAAPSLVKRLPRAKRGLLTLDRIIGRILPSIGDFFVIELVRR